MPGQIGCLPGSAAGGFQVLLQMSLDRGIFGFQIAVCHCMHKLIRNADMEVPPKP